MFGCRWSSVWERLHFVRRIDWRPLLILAWGLILVLPIRQTGWLCDDLYNSSLPGLMIYRNTSPLADAANEITGWANSQGRINPGVHLWKELIFLAPNLYWYKWGQVAAVLIALLVFYGCLRGMDADADLAALSCLLVAGLIQFRASVDPVLAFNFLMPLLLLLTSVSVLLLHRHRITGGRLALAGSLVLYAAAALTYEMTYPFWILHAWVLVRTRAGWKRGALLLLPFVAVPVLLTLGSMYLRSRLPTDGAYAVHLHPKAMAVLFLKQCLAAFPCSYAGLCPTSPVARVFTWATFRHYSVVTAFGVLLYWTVVARLIRRARDGGRPLVGWAAFGLFLAVLPVPVLCVCNRYQNAFPYGDAHLPVFVEYFGVAVLLAAGVAALGGRLRRGPAWLLALPPALLFAAFTTLDYAGNVRLVACLPVPYLSPRCEIEEAIDAGLLRGVAPGGVLVTDQTFPWEAPVGDAADFYYCCHTRTRLGEVVGPAADALRRFFPDRTDAAKQDVTRVRYVNLRQPGGFSLAGKMRYARWDPEGKLCEAGLDDMRLAVWRGGKDGALNDRPFVLHTSCRREGRSEPIALPSAALRRVRTTAHWTFYEVDASHPCLDGEAVWLEFPPAAGG